MAHHLADLMRSEAEAAAGGDEERWLSHYSEDAVFRYPGSNPFAGEYRGHDGLRRWRRTRASVAAKLDRLSAELHDALGSDDHGVQLYTVTAQKGDRSLTWRGAIVCHASDGRITDAWVVIDPMAELDEFLTWAASD
jgi:ketosteroid isomerase-like protein